VDGVEVSGSLRALAERYGVGVKGTEVLDALGKRRDSFTPEQLSRYGDYCINDVNLTYDLFRILGKNFPKKELKLIDLTLRMFIDPVLVLDTGLLKKHLTEIREYKASLLDAAGVGKDDLMSNPKFAKLLEALDVEPPMKISPATGKQTFAFAKSDEGFVSLGEHYDPEVQKLFEARLANKSTLEETRTQRFIDIASRGTLPVPIRYYAAHTGRWGGDDKINLQNLPSRGVSGNVLKRSILAPEGCSLIDADSSQIEARVLAWLAGQDDLTTAFADGEDVYKKMASRIYEVEEENISKEQRFVGKTTILGAGYGMGAVRFKDQLKNFATDIELKEARRIIKIYRDTNGQINRLWRDAQTILKNIHNGSKGSLGINGLVCIIDEEYLSLPSGLRLHYDDLKSTTTDMGVEYDYKTRRGRTRIYGGKVIENVCQALARCIIGEQMLEVSKRYKVVLTVHDSIACCVPDEEVDEARNYIENCMRTAPKWASKLPLDCESGVGKSYGGCE
jgi:DNA polymerase